ncbi:MAG: WYL domain-containing protein [Bacteroidales bacterium]|nr:WYL domain-containing protein [Bacteroidales bacterium]
MVTELLNKYIWLVNTFVRAGERGLSLDEICRRWESRFGSSYSRRTFNNHRMNVEEIFGIRIDCNRSTNRYFIDCSDDVSDENEESAWLINTFTVNNMLSLGKERLRGRVSVEDIPSGHRFLTVIMDAMTECRELRISYRKYTSTETGQYTIHPYAVKEAGRRWYLIGYCVEREGLRVYGLDRVLDITETGRTFRMDKDFDVDEMFATSFGIYLPEGPGKTITFRTGMKDASYLRDLPMHKSQEEIANDGNSVTFSIFVCPDKAMIMEFCKFGSRIEVLSPESVRKEVAEELRRASELYR